MLGIVCPAVEKHGIYPIPQLRVHFGVLRVSSVVFRPAERKSQYHELVSRPGLVGLHPGESYKEKKLAPEVTCS